MQKTELKPLTLEAVWNAAEALIFAHGSTTIPAVSERLSIDGFAVMQAEVAEALAYLAEEDGWSFTSEGDCRTYYFEEDTDEVAHFYREHNGRFWEVVVVGRILFRSSGRVGTLGVHRQYELSSNRFAFFEARRLLADREAFGFAEAEDIRPEVVYRLPYWSVLDRQPVRVALKYRNVRVCEEVLGYFERTPRQTVRCRVSKNCRYTLQWEANLPKMPIKEMLLLDRFDPVLFPADEIILHNEQLTDLQTCDADGPMPEVPRAFIELAAPAILQMEAERHDLEYATIEYADGQVVELSRRQWAEEEFWSRLLLLCAHLS